MARNKILASSMFTVLVLLCIQNLNALQNNSNFNDNLSTNNMTTNDSITINTVKTNYHWYIGFPPGDLIFSFVPVDGVLQPFYSFGAEYCFDTKNSITFGLGASKFAGVFSDLLLLTPYPGYIWTYLSGIGYTRYIWENLSVSLSLSPQYIAYYDNNGNFLASGFQMYIMCDIGYRFDFILFSLPLYVSVFFEADYLAYLHDSSAPQRFREIDRMGSPFTFVPLPGIEIGYRF